MQDVFHQSVFETESFSCNQFWLSTGWKKKEILYDYWINVSCCQCENKLGKQQNTDKSKPNTFMSGFLFKTLVLVGCSTLQTCNDELLNNLSSFHFRVKLYSSLRWKGIIKDLCQPSTVDLEKQGILCFNERQSVFNRSLHARCRLSTAYWSSAIPQTNLTKTTPNRFEIQISWEIWEAINTRGYSSICKEK